MINIGGLNYIKVRDPKAGETGWAIVEKRRNGCIRQRFRKLQGL